MSYEGALDDLGAPGLVDHKTCSLSLCNSATALVSIVAVELGLLIGVTPPLGWK